MVFQEGARLPYDPSRALFCFCRRLLSARFHCAHLHFRIVTQIFARSRASSCVQLYSFNRSMDESEILNGAHLDDELDVDDGWAAGFDSGDCPEA